MYRKTLKCHYDFVLWKEHLDATVAPMHYWGSDRKFEGYSYRHDNSPPEKFPCLVTSCPENNDNGPDYFNHDFIYFEDIQELVEAQFEATAEA